jgi:hypothetical protein
MKRSRPATAACCTLSIADFGTRGVRRASRGGRYRYCDKNTDYRDDALCRAVV